MTEPLTRIQLDQFDALAGAATPGPWKSYHPSEIPQDIRIARDGVVSNRVRSYVGRVTTSHDPKKSGGSGGALKPPRDEDVRFMAAARAGGPATTAELRRAAAVLCALEWSAGGEDGCELCCPECGGTQTSGQHLPDCALGSLVRRLAR